MTTNLILVGFMGTGKSTVGRALAKRLGWPHVDLDEAIVLRDGRDIPAIFQQDGEEYFRDLESQVLGELLQREGQVITTGGGAVLRPQNVAAMLAKGTVVALSASRDEIVRRVCADTGRPLLAGDVERRVDELLAARAGAYDFAPVQVDTTGRDVDAIAAEIVSRLVERGDFRRD